MNKKILISVFVVLVVALMIGIIYFGLFDRKITPLEQSQEISWKTYENKDYSFSLIYPSDWKINDQSYTYTNKSTSIKNAALEISSPMRTDIPGYESPGARYSIQFSFNEDVPVVSYQGFLKAHVTGDQAAVSIPLDQNIVEQYDEFVIAKKIIASAKVNKDISAGNIELLYPKGGEIININQPFFINYKISSELKQKISATDKTEVYLLDKENTLVGYIGKFDINDSQFMWDTRLLYHNGGLDFSVTQTPVGEYRILILIRKGQVYNGSYDNDAPAVVDTLDSPYVTYSNGKLFIGNELMKTQPIFSDVSSDLFTLISK